MQQDNRGRRVFVKRFINPLLRNVAFASHGPFALLRHEGRQSGKAYEIPIMVWWLDEGFVIVLTYGPHVDWLRNLQAAGQGSLLWHRRNYVFQMPKFIDANAALPALPPVLRSLFRLRRGQQFVLLPFRKVV